MENIIAEYTVSELTTEGLIVALKQAVRQLETYGMCNIEFGSDFELELNVEEQTFVVKKISEF